MNKKQKQAEAILQHGFDLQRNFGNGSGGGPVTLCKALRRIETKLHRWAEDVCNGVKQPTDAEFDRIHDRAVNKVAELLPELPKDEIKINTDPRGYALKVEDTYMRSAGITDLHRDWGGYGILAPDIN